MNVMNKMYITRLPIDGKVPDDSITVNKASSDNAVICIFTECGNLKVQQHL